MQIKEIDVTKRKKPPEQWNLISRERKPTWMHWWDVRSSDVVILFGLLTPKVNLYVSHMIIKSETTKVSFSLKHFCYVHMSLNTVPFFKFCHLQSTNRMNTKMNTSVSCDILINGCFVCISHIKDLIYMSQIEQSKNTTVS